jgi:hypothetical protein
MHLFLTGINPLKNGWRDRLPIPRLDETTLIHRMFGGYFRSQVCLLLREFLCYEIVK